MGGLTYHSEIKGRKIERAPDRYWADAYHEGGGEAVGRRGKWRDVRHIERDVSYFLRRSAIARKEYFLAVEVVWESCLIVLVLFD